MDTIVLDRIAELLAYRRWFRANRWANWTTLRWEYDVELRALVRLARAERRLARRGSAALADGDFYAGMPR